jgi:arylsulfatase
VNLDPPFDETSYELFNIATDPGETTDLRERDPDRFAAMVELWERKRLELGILLPDDIE